jgi:hypothetical protein
MRISWHGKEAVIALGLALALLLDLKDDLLSRQTMIVRDSERSFVDLPADCQSTGGPRVLEYGKRFLGRTLRFDFWASASSWPRSPR